MTPGVKSLLVANVAMYVVAVASPAVAQALMLVPMLIPSRPWTVVTYMFLHAGVFHLAFNMLALYFFGPRLEVRLGTAHFFGLYFVSGLVGALASLTTPTAAIVGASAAIFGVMLGYARYWPTDLIFVWGIVPIPARWFVIGMTALSLFAGFGGMQAGVAHFAHLGGFLGGWLYLKWLERYSPAAKFRAAADAPQHPRESLAAALERWRRIPLDNLHPVNREEVERLLRKGEEGPALTPQERAVLDRFTPS
ncbi:MAG TPA: rhomboid family intramembrane serine protease [Gemmatimonadales bacterium]|nr:rhomboid family intramembrane serine protease [Gemmatimonadales bacterium]